MGDVATATMGGSLRMVRMADLREPTTGLNMFGSRKRSNGPRSSAEMRASGELPAELKLLMAAALSALLPMGLGALSDVRCPACEGSGWADLEALERCGLCKGFGVVPKRVAEYAMGLPDLDPRPLSALPPALPALECPTCEAAMELHNDRGRRFVCPNGHRGVKIDADDHPKFDNRSSMAWRAAVAQQFSKARRRRAWAVMARNGATLGGGPKGVRA